MDITEIKFKGNDTEIKYFVSSLESITESKKKCEQVRHPDFDRDVELLIPIILKRYEMPLYFAEGCKIESIKISASRTKGEGWLIPASVMMSREASDFKPNFELYTGNIFLEEAQELFKKILNHAVDFINGKRAQGDLFENEFSITGEEASRISGCIDNLESTGLNLKIHSNGETVEVNKRKSAND